MIAANFSKQDLLKTFLPLSDGGKTFLEILLVNPKTMKVEGRGFFNDVDFLLDTCKPLVGRFNFCLSNFGFPQDKIPSRGAFNQFDRTLLDSSFQDQAKAHSLTVALLFKPELIREMTEQGLSSDQFLNIKYQIDAIFNRLNISNYSLDYFLTGVALRFRPAETLHQHPLNKAALILVTNHIIALVEKKMNGQEVKRFSLTASVLGKVWDPTPGLPGIFAGEASGSMTATSSGSLEPGENAIFQEILEDIFDPKAKAGKEGNSLPNTKGLSQNWQDSEEVQFETAPAQDLDHEVHSSQAKERYSDPKEQLNSKELMAFFHLRSQSQWRWPLYSSTFNRLFGGLACGEMLLLQSDPFAAELAFHFLLQCAEAFSKEGKGQFLIFSKKRSLGELALSSLSRHYKTNPLTSSAASKPDSATLAKTYAALFPNAPHMPACNRVDGLEQLLKYLEHDYLLKQKKKGGQLAPLIIILDNLSEFSQGNPDEDLRRLSAMKLRLAEFNSSLWVTQMRPLDPLVPQANLALANYLVTLDHNGAQDSTAQAKLGQPSRPSEWEAGFHAEFTAEMLIKEFSLLKFRFQCHGSHRNFQGHYAYHRPSFLFHEINPAPASASNHSTSASASGAPAPQTRASA